MIKTQRIVLTVPQFESAVRLARERLACKLNKPPTWSKSRSPFSTHFIGALGEVLVWKAHPGSSINTNIDPMGDRHGADLVLADGSSVEVKARDWNGQSNIHLIFTNDEVDALRDRDIDYIALVQVMMPDAGIVWPLFKRSDVLASVTRHDYGYGERWQFIPGEHDGATASHSDR